MKSIHQVLPSFAKYDAIGCNVLEIQKKIKDKGFKSEIFFEHKLPMTGNLSRPFSEFIYEPDCLGVIYHHSIGSKWPLRLLEMQPPRLVTVYHNITPPEYFMDLHGGSLPSAMCRAGVRQLDILRVISDHAWADSQYNAHELKDSGFKNIEVLPILRDYNRLTQLASDPDLNKLLDDKIANILFVGRVLPSKCQHKLLRILCMLKAIGLRARLIIPGSVFKSYGVKLERYADQLGLKLSKGLHGDFKDCDVLMPDQVSDSALATFYRTARVFLSASEHEGFCVPIVEAMFFGVPLLANPMGAVPETLGKAGGLIDINNDEQVLDQLKLLLLDDEYWQKARSRSLSESLRYAEDKLDSIFNEVFNAAFADALPWARAKQNFTVDSTLDCR